MSTGWRPNKWEGQPDFCGRCKEHPKSCYICVAGYESGATAMLSAVVKYLDQADDLSALNKLLLGLKSSVGLNQIMGKFPDLPDVTEAK
jgi:hypothetical protein